MKLYYHQSEFSPGKHRVVAAIYDTDLFKFDTGTLSPFSTLSIDEVDPNNKAICLDLVRTANRTDEAGEGKYYVSNGQLMEKEGWTERTPEV